MKTSGQIKWSFSGAPLFTRRSIWSSTACERGPNSTYAYSYLSRKRPRLPAYRRKADSQQELPQSQTATLLVPPPVFVKALHHGPRSRNEPSKFRSIWQTRKRKFSSAGQEQEDENEKTDPAQPNPPGREELLSMVDGLENNPSVEEQWRFINDRYLRGYATANGPELTVSERMDDQDFPSFGDIHTNDDGISHTVHQLWRAVRSSLKSPPTTDIEYIWNLYQSLPEPRMVHIPALVRHAFMRVIGQEKKNYQTMLRYFSAVADIQNSGLHLIPAEWNQGLSLAGRHVGRTSTTELESTMRLWNQMETESDVKANAVTFNVLFDVASKAGNYALAEMFYKEMERRGFTFNRYHHVSLIHFFGLKSDSDGIRAAYKEMVIAGEMIDSSVLNCVMVGFLRCGEEYAAERLYERMKSSHQRAPEMPYRNYMSDKVVTKVMQMFSKVSRRAGDKELHNHLQQISPIVPDIKTYNIMLAHFALRTSSMDKVAQYLDDMKWFRIPMNGAIFLTLFKGFTQHGRLNLAWSPGRLEKVYQALLSARKENVHGIYISVWMAKWIMRAFNKCVGEARMWEVWAEIEPYCETDFEPEGAEYFKLFLADMVSRPRDSWRFRDTYLYGLLG